VVKKLYVPERGDIVQINFSPQSGKEMKDPHPALILTPSLYNNKTSLAVMCRITSKQKGYPFEVVIPLGLKVKGVILVDQLKSLDWRSRSVTFWDKLDLVSFDDVLAKMRPLLGL
jgi:mRNA interferase MazF